jgi:HlyD family secretion protein
MTPAEEDKRLGKLGDVITYMLGGVFVLVFIVGGATMWAATTRIVGAVVAPGTVVVESNVKKVQHPTGGVVGEIRIKEGDNVKAGDLVIRLDETITRANMQLIANQMDDFGMRAARLEAERDGKDQVTIPDQLAARQNDPRIAKIFADEQKLFATRRDSRQGQKAQLKERIQQFGEEILGVSGQIEAKSTEIQLIGKEIEALAGLEAQKLVTTEKMVRLRRDAARLKGEFGELKSAAAQAKGKIAEVELQILRVDQDAKTEVVKELRETQLKLSELGERRIAAEDQLKRVEIRAPLDGVVHQLAVHTIGGVVNPSEPVMLIVPENDRLVIEAHVEPQSIDQVYSGQKAVIRFTAFQQDKTPELNAKVKGISANSSRDEKTGQVFFTVRLEISDEEMKRLGENKKLVPGMIADVQISTEERTVLSFLIKPLMDNFNRMFRG